MLQFIYTFVREGSMNSLVHKISRLPLLPLAFQLNVMLFYSLFSQQTSPYTSSSSVPINNHSSCHFVIFFTMYMNITHKSLIEDSCDYRKREREKKKYQTSKQAPRRKRKEEVDFYSDQNSIERWSYK